MNFPLNQYWSATSTEMKKSLHFCIKFTFLFSLRCCFCFFTSFTILSKGSNLRRTVDNVRQAVKIQQVNRSESFKIRTTNDFGHMTLSHTHTTFSSSPSKFMFSRFRSVQQINTCNTWWSTFAVPFIATKHNLTRSTTTAIECDRPLNFFLSNKLIINLFVRL